MDKIEIIAAIVGLLYLWLEYKANVLLWLVGVVMPLLYIYIFFDNKFYADMVINVYYLLASLYGWWRWQIGKRNTGSEIQSKELPISHTPRRFIWILFTIFIICFATTAFVLIRFTDSPVPYGDSFTTALSIIGMWMLANKYVEQWWIWVVVNAVSAWLYYTKLMTPTAILYVIYTVVSIFGYFKWKKLMDGELIAENLKLTK